MTLQYIGYANCHALHGLSTFAYIHCHFKGFDSVQQRVWQFGVQKTVLPTNLETNNILVR